MAAEPLDLEAESHEHVAVRLERVALGGGEMQRERKEQPLRRRLAALEHAHEPLVQHALVRRVLVDEDDAVVVLEQHVRAPQLKQRRNDRVASRGMRWERRRRKDRLGRTLPMLFVDEVPVPFAPPAMSRAASLAATNRPSAGARRGA